MHVILCVFCFSACACVAISVVLSYYVLRCHYIIELAAEREMGGGGQRVNVRCQQGIQVDQCE